MTRGQFIPIPPSLPGPGDIGSSMVDGLMRAITQWITNGARDAVGQVISFISNSTGLDVAGAFTGSGRSAVLLHKVVQLSAVLMVGFIFLAVIQALAAGEPSMMVRSVLLRVPISVLGTVALVAVCDTLLRATDGLSVWVLGDAATDLTPFLDLFTQASNSTGNSAAIAIVGLLAMIAALMVLIVLVVRSALIYVLICLAPMLLAARIWPAASGSWRKLAEGGVALILSKFAISIALALGAALLGDGSTFEANSAAGIDSAGQSIGKLAAGGALLGIAAFMPLVLLKLIPIVEGAVMAQGITGAPMRGANQASSMSYHVSRLTGGGGGSGGSASPDAAGASGGGGGVDVATAPIGSSGGTAAAGAGGAGAGAAGAGGAAAGGAGAGAAASGAGATAASGPAAVVVGPAMAAKAAADTAKQTATNAATGASEQTGSPSSSSAATRATAPTPGPANGDEA